MHEVVMFKQKTDHVRIFGPPPPNWTCLSILQLVSAPSSLRIFTHTTNTTTLATQHILSGSTFLSCFSHQTPSTMTEPYSIVKPVGFTIASCGYCGSDNSAHVYGAFAYKLTCKVSQ
jgi:hypothetical protein